MNKNSKVTFNPDADCIAVGGVPKIVDRLRSKRAQVASAYTKRLKQLDRQIDLLERSDAESIVEEAEEILHQDDYS